MMSRLVSATVHDVDSGRQNQAGALSLELRLVVENSVFKNEHAFQERRCSR
jgi:hypothetical protein